MKTVFKFLFIFFILGAFAQNAQSQDIQKVFTGLVDGLKPEAFKGSWANQKDAWMDRIGGLDIAKMNETQDEILDLVKNIKPKAFNKGVHKELLGQLASQKNAAQLTNLMDTLVRGIKPSMFKDGFSPNSLLSEIGKFM